MKQLVIEKNGQQAAGKRRPVVPFLQTMALIGLIIAAARSPLVDSASTGVEEDHYAPEESISPEIRSSPMCEMEKGEERIDEGDIIVVFAVDGTLAGICKGSGKVLWKHSNDLENGEIMGHQRTTMKPRHSSKKTLIERLVRPLVSTTTTTKAASSSSTNFAAVPSLDGNVFMSSCGETVKNSVKEIVSRSPFLNDNGRFFVGSRYSTAAALDAKTGEVLRVIPSSEIQRDIHHSTPLKGRNPVWIGRVDYSVDIQDAKSGTTEVQFSASEVISVAEMRGKIGRDVWKPMNVFDDDEQNIDDAVSIDELERIASHSSLFVVPTTAMNSELSPLVGGDIAYRNPASGVLEWVADETFSSPVAFAIEASSGERVEVDFIPDVPVPGSSSEYLLREIDRQLAILSEQAIQDQTIVSSLSNGQLYALNLGNKLMLPGISSQRHTIVSASLASNQKVLSNFPRIGRPAIHHDAVNLHNRAHDKKQLIATRKTCNPGNPSFPTCVLSPGDRHDRSKEQKDRYSREESDLIVRDSSSDGEDVAIAASQLPDGVFFHPEYGYFAPRHRRPKYRRYLTMGLWLPPALAFIFVISFELGRRKRQKDNQRLSRSAVRMVDGVGEVVWSDSKPAEVPNQCVIQVSDEILGYGGQGTVVYKGKLDGRDVAVKRLLKAYQAGADREISLLIESDGHPNVVRYFLKEIRGDFVYLALELCDLSLHDLIVVLRQHHEQGASVSHKSICPSTKYVLEQIASGVRHLHSLRIVHRDLKPANILMSSLRKSPKKISVLDAFQKGLYVAKISDMGLGKQLAGQSSLGVSMLGESNRDSKPGASSVGVGPGSVGWQAPEVMALKWTSDSSVHAECSSGLPSSSQNQTPIDTMSGTRTSRSVDIFSLGCIFYSTIVPGRHPFGEWYERESNIMHNRPALGPLKKISPDAHDLVMSMLQQNPKLRPTAKQICDHPFFWSAQKRLSFLCDLSDRLETDDATEKSAFPNSTLAIERGALEVIGTAWDGQLNDILISNVQKFRSYDRSSLRDLLRLIRNKHHHFDELPDDFRKSTMPNQEKMLQYFEELFPSLLMHCFHHCELQFAEDDLMARKYAIVPRQATGRETRLLKCFPNTTYLNQNETSGDSTGSSLSHETTGTFPSEGILVRVENNNPSDDGIPPLADEVKRFGSAEKGSELSVPIPDDIIAWEGSAAAKTFNCRGWSRSEDEWSNRIDSCFRKRDPSLKRAAEDPKFRTRLCNHWDTNLGTFCPMRRKSKCIFAHGPVELRVKEGKRGRWGRLLDKNGNNSNPWHSGGEDTYGAAKSIESARKVEGKWKTNRASGKNKSNGAKKKTTR